jgi:hypothetical protein
MKKQYEVCDEYDDFYELCEGLSDVYVVIWS